MNYQVEAVRQDGIKIETQLNYLFLKEEDSCFPEWLLFRFVSKRSSIRAFSTSLTFGRSNRTFFNFSLLFFSNSKSCNPIVLIFKAALKDTEKFLLIKMIDYKDGLNQSDAVEKIWMDEKGYFWSSYHLNCDLDDLKLKFRITNKNLIAEYREEFLMSIQGIRRL